MNGSLHHMRRVAPEVEAVSQMLAEALMPEEDIEQILADHPTLTLIGDESALPREEWGSGGATLGERQEKLFLPESRAAAERTRIILSACSQINQYKSDAYSLKHRIEGWLRVFGVEDFLGTDRIHSERMDHSWRRSTYVAQGAALVGVAAAGFSWRNRQRKTFVNVGQTSAPPPGSLNLPLSKRTFNRMTRDLNTPELRTQARTAPLPQKGS